MKICIVGAGWYGCHTANYLRSKGVEVDILDKETTLFAGASSKNQNRLHLGYHYPRSEETIRECQAGFTRFNQQYGEYVHEFSKNYYLIHDHSKTSLDDYIRRFNPVLVDLEVEVNYIVQSAIVVNEKHIDNEGVKRMFERTLLSLFKTIDGLSVAIGDQEIIVNGVTYNALINCTNNQWVPVPLPFTPVYETFCSLVYEIDFEEITAFTIMDGAFFSIFPYDIPNRLYTLTHVEHGVLSRSQQDVDADTSIIESRKNAIESDIFKCLPFLRSKMKYVRYFLSKKTKYDFEKDDRSVRIFRSGRYLSFSGGKITGIFETEQHLDRLLSEIQQSSQMEV